MIYMCEKLVKIWLSINQNITPLSSPLPKNKLKMKYDVQRLLKIWLEIDNNSLNSDYRNKTCTCIYKNLNEIKFL